MAPRVRMCTRIFRTPTSRHRKSPPPFLFDVNKDSRSDAISAALLPNIDPVGPKMAPRWLQDSPRCPKMDHDGPEGARAHAHCWWDAYARSHTTAAQDAPRWFMMAPICACTCALLVGPYARSHTTASHQLRGGRRTTSGARDV